MNRMIIGAAFLLCGTLLFSAILVAGAVFSTALDSWSGSKLWYAILGNSYPDEGMQTMGLSFFFYFSIILFLIGFIMLLWETIVNTFNKLD